MATIARWRADPRQVHPTSWERRVDVAPIHHQVLQTAADYLRTADDELDDCTCASPTSWAEPVSRTSDD